MIVWLFAVVAAGPPVCSARSVMSTSNVGALPREPAAQHWLHRRAGHRDRRIWRRERHAERELVPARRWVALRSCMENSDLVPGIGPGIHSLVCQRICDDLNGLGTRCVCLSRVAVWSVPVVLDGVASVGAVPHASAEAIAKFAIAKFGLTRRSRKSVTVLNRRLTDCSVVRVTAACGTDRRTWPCRARVPEALS